MKWKIAFVFILITIMITGCNPYSYSQEDELNDEYHSGTQGLVMNFLPESPPKRLYENSELDVWLEYSNKGAYDVRGGKVYLSGFDTQYIQFVPDMIPNLESDSKSRFNPDGKLTKTESFSAYSVQLPMGADKITQTIKATACYEYRTEAAIEVCIDPKTKNIRDDICTVEPISLSGGQGAPVAITKIEEEIYKNKLQFRIYFENAGDGTVIRTGRITNCHTSLEREDANKVDVRTVSFSGNTMFCEPQPPIQLDDRGKGFVFCSYQGDLGDEAYKTLLQIELDYGYRSSIQRDVEILQEP
ncbi:hypothetical protein GOV08_02360 [Candidatus Woesearchaeota archaeon]|nr:hypothetical protein [Candidatus Woesearchaeota archaeon]